jgi:hypothetical protein
VGKINVVGRLSGSFSIGSIGGSILATHIVRVPDKLWGMILVEAAKDNCTLGVALLRLVERSELNTSVSIVQEEKVEIPQDDQEEIEKSFPPDKDWKSLFIHKRGSIGYFCKTCNHETGSRQGIIAHIKTYHPELV